MFVHEAANMNVRCLGFLLITMGALTLVRMVWRAVTPLINGQQMSNNFHRSNIQITIQSNLSIHGICSIRSLIRRLHSRPRRHVAHNPITAVIQQWRRAAMTNTWPPFIKWQNVPWPNLMNRRNHEIWCSITASMWKYTEFTDDSWVPRTNAENVSIWWRHHEIVQMYHALYALRTTRFDGHIY